MRGKSVVAALLAALLCGCSAPALVATATVAAPGDATSTGAPTATPRPGTPTTAGQSATATATTAKPAPAASTTSRTTTAVPPVAQVAGGIGGRFAGRSSLWLPYWQQSSAVRTASATNDLFGTANLFWYDATGCSTVAGYPGAGDSSVVSALRGKGLKVVATVTASGLGPSAAISCLGDPARRDAHVAKLASLVRAGGFDGIDIDYEQLAETTDPAVARRVRSAFTAFGQALCARMDALGKTCYLTVMPRTDDSLAVWRGSIIPGVFDYAPLAEAATHLRIMAYDQHAYAYGPGPMAGLPWVKAIMAYAESKASRAKLELGVPDYGRDFSGGTHRAAEGNRPVQLAAEQGVTPTWDATQAEYTFRYVADGVQHVVWYSGPDSVAIRYALAKARGWAGVGVWAAASEVPGTWTAVRSG